MATLCRNCSHALVLNPDSLMLECSFCGSTFIPEEIEAEAKKYREDLEPVKASEVYNSDEEDLMDCYIYSCSECGGEIIINGTEASTSCVYCGNPNVVFNRIARMKKPEFIMPFRITKENAVSIARKKIRAGAFVPKAIKNFSVDCCRGIYLPYWFVNADYYDTVIIQGSVGEKSINGKQHVVTRYFGRSGKMTFKDLPIDASRVLSDESSSKLEPFDMQHLIPFDDDYLAGFYSNVSDVTYDDVKKAAIERGKEFFAEAAFKDISASDKKIVDRCPSIEVDKDMKYAMLPAWFITFDYKEKHHTILVNGDNGKVVCALPWKKVKLSVMLAVIALVTTVLSYYPLYVLLEGIFTGSDNSRKGSIRLLVFVIVGIITLFSSGISWFKKVIDNIKLTQDKDIFDFTKKRQG